MGGGCVTVASLRAEQRVEQRLPEAVRRRIVDAEARRELALANRIWERRTKPAATEAGHAS